MTLNIPFRAGRQMLDELLGQILPVCLERSVKVRILDNSRSIDMGMEGVSVLVPTVPLSFSQTQNWIQELTMCSDEKCALFAHYDASISAEAFVRMMEAVKEPGWGVIFTHYDVFCAFHVRVMKMVGPWDAHIPWYRSDNDWYRRVRNAGFTMVELGGDGVEHKNDASNTIKADWRARAEVDSLHVSNLAYYANKWGFKDDFEVPWNGKYLIPPLDWIRATVVFERLKNSYTTTEATLFEFQPDDAIEGQCRIIAWAYARAGSPARVLETGMAKGYFGMLLGFLNPRCSLTTVDGDPRTALAAVHLAAHLRLDFFQGSSHDLFLQLPKDAGFGFAWIDAGHSEELAYLDISSSIKLGVPVIAIDDVTDPRVALAIDRVLESNQNYRRLRVPEFGPNPRGIAVIEKLPE